MGRTSTKSTKSNKTNQDDAKKPSQSDAIEAKKKLEDIRTSFLVKFGQVTLSLMGVPRYGHQSISDIQKLALEPLIRDRIAVATAKESEDKTAQNGAIAGIAI